MTDAPHVGVFSLRAPDRPNPIGLHPVEIVAVSGLGSRSTTSRRSTGRQSGTLNLSSEIQGSLGLSACRAAKVDRG
ncbi:MAG TPA: TrmO family methyltransferase [Candidatus Dormibacteraeota bacterium]|nr:TrmO family methyltransferase [Candidatus Dormibacteraeota bacterium]